MNYAIVENGLVVNVIVWGGDTDEWRPSEGQAAVQIPDGAYVGIGSTYSNGVFGAPTQNEVTP